MRRANAAMRKRSHQEDRGAPSQMASQPQERAALAMLATGSPMQTWMRQRIPPALSSSRGPRSKRSARWYSRACSSSSERKALTRPHSRGGCTLSNTTSVTAWFPWVWAAWFTAHRADGASSTGTRIMLIAFTSCC